MNKTGSSRRGEPPRFDIDEGETAVIRIEGDLTLGHLSNLYGKFKGLPDDADVTLRLSDLGQVDTAGAWLIAEYADRVASRGGKLTLDGASEAQSALIDTVREARFEDEPEPARRTWTDRLEAIGRAVVAGGKVFLDLAGYLGLFLSRLWRAILNPRSFRLTALVAHAEDVGWRALPIVALMSFLIGVVLAFQGAAQLRQFGAEIFVVDLIAISLLRELGILLTAIIVAGRTASAFTASIGSMKMREEVDAMLTLGIDPVQALIVPRVLALIVTLPILGLVANLAGLIGGALMAWIELGVSPAIFLNRLATESNFQNAVVGFVKAPVFAILIGIVGCYAGMQVRGNAESLGLMTSKAVVAAIFLVIVADALFSVFFQRVGL